MRRRLKPILTRALLAVYTAAWSLSTLAAVPVHLAWDLPDPLDSRIEGYQLAYGSSTGNYSTFQNVSGASTTTATLNLATGATYYIAARSRSFSLDLSSAYSNEVSINIAAENTGPGGGTGDANVTIPPCQGSSIFPSTTPTAQVSTDSRVTELGLKFKSDVNGWICGVRYYKTAANKGPHTASLWMRNGNRLAKTTFWVETDQGWQQANFAKPIKIAANTIYIVSYLAPEGHFSYTDNVFTNAVNNGHLIAVKHSNTTLNGIYRNTHVGLMPATASKYTNYWVDVIFTTTAPSN